MREPSIQSSLRNEMGATSEYPATHLHVIEQE